VIFVIVYFIVVVVPLVVVRTIRATLKVFFRVLRRNIE
jgi:hypothetical protein